MTKATEAFSTPNRYLRVGRLITLIITSVLALVAILVLIFFLVDKNNDNQYTLYYAEPCNDSEFRICSEQRYLSLSGTVSSRAGTVLRMLIEGPVTDTLSSPFPDGLSVLSFRVIRGIAHLDLSEEYMNLDSFDMRVADCCLVNTLIGLEGIKALNITVNGEQHPYFGPKSVSKNDFIISNDAFVTYDQKITLYLPISSDYLGVYNTSISRPADTPPEEYVLDLLMNKSFGDEYLPVTEGSGIFSSVSTYNGTAYVDLSEDFLGDGRSDRTQLIYISLYSIVNSLTELPDIDSVVFTFDGLSIKEFNGIDLSKPLLANTDIIRFDNYK